MPSLLAHLAGKFSEQHEVVATDALTFILGRSTAARRALEQLLATTGARVAVARVSPQYFAGEESRPDLATFGADDRLTAFIEAKFWAGLTDAQPVGYLARLLERGGRALVFVVPHERIASVSANLASRAKEAQNVLSFTSNEEGVVAAVASDGIRVVVLSWKRLDVALTAGCGRADDTDALADLHQLRGLVARYEAEGFVPMNPAELSDVSFPRRVRALSDLVQALVMKGVAAGIFDLDRTRPTHTWVSVGRYLGTPHCNTWIGVDYDAWGRYHASPIWLWFEVNDWSCGREVRRALQSWEVREPRRMYINAEDESVSIPLFILPGAEQEAVLEHLLMQVREVDGALEAGGLVRKGSAARPKE